MGPTSMSLGDATKSRSGLQCACSERRVTLGAEGVCRHPMVCRGANTTVRLVEPRDPNAGRRQQARRGRTASSARGLTTGDVEAILDRGVERRLL